MLSLGRVIKIRDHEILVSLPGRTMGSVPITSISAPYTKALETLTADGNTEDVCRSNSYFIELLFIKIKVRVNIRIRLLLCSPCMELTTYSKWVK